jgi:integrase
MKTSKPDWPKIVTVGNASVKVYKRQTGSGNAGFQIVYRDIDGKRKFESESDEAQALKLATKKAETLSTFGARVAGTKSNDMAEFVRASDLLKPFSITVGTGVERLAGWLLKFVSLDGIDRALLAGPVQHGDGIVRSVASAIDEMIALKVSNGISDCYRRDLKTRLVKQFAVAFKCDIGTVTAPMIQSWLDGQKLNPTTYNNMRRLVGVLFEHCVKRGYCAVNPIAKVETRKPRATVAEIYTPEQMAKLLAVSDNGFQLMLAICGFAGLRTAEFERLTWGHVDFESGHLILSPDITKTNKRRLVPMSANLRAWLEQHPKEKRIGRVWHKKRIVFERQACGVNAGVPWMDNALRHSFCSYRLALTGDAPRTAFEAGNSPSMIDKHYKALVTEQSAREWFALVPTSPA